MVNCPIEFFEDIATGTFCVIKIKFLKYLQIEISVPIIFLCLETKLELSANNFLITFFNHIDYNR